MNLTITSREVQGVTVLDLSGKVVLGEECNALRAQIKELLGAGRKKLLINLAEVKRVDSSGIGALVEGVILTVKEGGEIKLVNLDRVLYNTLATHRLLPAFEVFENEAAALASFK